MFSDAFYDSTNAWSNIAAYNFRQEGNPDQIAYQETDLYHERMKSVLDEYTYQAFVQWTEPAFENLEIGSAELAVELAKTNFKIFTGFIYKLDWECHLYIKQMASLPRRDFSHRVPRTFLDDEIIRGINEEIKCLPTEDQELFFRAGLFFFVYKKSILKNDELKIINYLDGGSTLEEIGLTRENGAYFLKLTKILDLAFLWQTRISRTCLEFKNSSESIRTGILQLLSSEMTPKEAHLLAVDPRRIEAATRTAKKKFNDETDLYRERMRPIFKEYLYEDFVDWTESAFENLDIGSAESALELAREDPMIFPGFIAKLDWKCHAFGSKLTPIPRIDLRHRVSKTFLKDDNIREINDEIECLSPENQESFLRAGLFFFVYQKSLLNSDELKIVNYLDGTGTLEEIGLNRDNGARFLKLTKIIDLALFWQTRISRTRILFQNSSEAIRTRILQLLSPEMTTTEAYTLAVDPRKINADYLKNQRHWITERMRFYLHRVIPKEYVEMIALSKRMKEERKIVALRGATASGKTTLVKKIYRKALNGKGELSGSVNPDTMKVALRVGELMNGQVHEEAVKGPLSDYKEAVLKGDQSLILDTRLSSCEDLAFVVQAAVSKKISLIDIDIPLGLSLARTLERDPYGKEPCVDPEALKKGWIEIRRARRGVIEMVKNSPQIDLYQLFFLGKLVAEKRNGEFRVLSKRHFKVCCSVPSLEEIESQFHSLVNFGKWKSIPLVHALKANSLGAPVKAALVRMNQLQILKRQYGAVSLEPFTGEWLSDYPQIKEHLDSEHRLHIRGLDANGRGLHWETNKFASNLDPQFNPERSFQMKLGYFLVPSSQVDVVKALSLSPDILKELEVDGSYRLFVHPEAYAHFQLLHDAKIPFVKPEHSEYMGTPTSSYRSWAIRRPSGTPFIVKFGVGNGNRLLSKDEVHRSIAAQQEFDKKPTGLTVFAETMGLSLRLPSYPQMSPTDSGMIVREFPKELLMGKVQIHSFSALMSVESGLPLIYKIMDATIKKGHASSPFDFIKRYLIDGAFEALGPLIFGQKLSLALHGQNLCMVLGSDLTPQGFAIRDHGDINHVRRYIETYSWFYRYHVFVKLLNVVTSSATEFTPPPPGAPTQIGHKVPLHERNLNFYLGHKLTGLALQKLKAFSLSFEEYHTLLELLDKSYLALLHQTFGVSLAAIPAAEIGSAGESEILKTNQSLDVRINNPAGGSSLPFTGYLCM